MFWSVCWKQHSKQCRSEGRTEGRGRRAGGRQATAPARGGEARRELQGAGKPAMSFYETLALVPLWLLSISQKDAWRRHRRFLQKQRSQERCKADSSAAVVSAEQEHAQKSLCSSSLWAAHRLWALLAGEPLPHVGTASEDFPGQPGTKVGPNNQLKASLLSLSRAFTKHNSAKTSEPDAHISNSHWDERLQSLNAYQNWSLCLWQWKAGVVFNLFGCICILTTKPCRGWDTEPWGFSRQRPGHPSGFLCVT